MSFYSKLKSSQLITPGSLESLPAVPYTGGDGVKRSGEAAAEAEREEVAGIEE